MTPAQRQRLYGPAWSSLARARGWTMSRGRLQADLVWQLEQARGHWPEPAGPLLAQVLHAAADLARQAHRAVHADDLRHACNVAVSGQPSGNRLSQAQLSRVIQLMRLLADPEDLGAVRDWIEPDGAERRHLVARILELAPATTVQAIARNMRLPEPWDTAAPLGALRSLHRLLQERSRARLGGEQPF